MSFNSWHPLTTPHSGLLTLTNAYTPPTADSVFGYEAYQYGPNKASWAPGFIQGNLPSNVTRYVTNGAAVNVPSENLGYYFSGMRGIHWGPIFQDEDSANVSANSLISVDMSMQRGEKWANDTIPSRISPRADAQLVWIPVSGQGVLVAIGGVMPPEELSSTGLNDTETSQSKAQSPTFMTSLPIYDIASRRWYLQNITGNDAPGQLTEFCSVVAVANDSSSFNVYIYGGYDGLASSSSPSDDVWILSIPAFTWTKAYSGTAQHGRSGHVCTQPYPDTMLVVGGIHQDPTKCLDGGFIQVFNLTTLQFQNTYDPIHWSYYEVPAAVTAVIGGNGKGSATKTANWDDASLSNIFATKYSKPIPRYFPYTPSNSTSTIGTPTASPTPAPHSGLAGWVAPVLGVVLGLIVISIIVVIVLLFRRRRLLRRSSVETTSMTGSSTNRIIRWVNGMPNAPAHKTDPSVTSTDPDDADVSSPTQGYAEVGGQQRYEMQAVERERPAVEMATPYNFQDHPSYPRSIDYAYGPSPGQPHTGSPSAFSPQTEGSSAPSPYVMPHSPNQIGSSTGSPIASNSDPPRSPSPSGATALSRETSEAARHAQQRPQHKRNVSSMSSDVNEPPSPNQLVSPEDDKRQSLYLASLPKQAPESDGKRGGGSTAQPLVSPETPRSAGLLAGHPTSTGKKSNFGEMLDEHNGQRR